MRNKQSHRNFLCEPGWYLGSIVLFAPKFSPIQSILHSLPLLFSRALKVEVLVIQSHPTLWPCCPPGSSVHRVLQARILELVAIPFSRDLPNARIKLDLLHCRQILYHLIHQGNSIFCFFFFFFSRAWEIHKTPQCLPETHPITCTICKTLVINVLIQAYINPPWGSCGS